MQLTAYQYTFVFSYYHVGMIQGVVEDKGAGIPLWSWVQDQQQYMYLTCEH